MGIKVKGLKELEKKFSNIPNKTKQGTRKAIEFIYNKSQPMVPVDTGRLKASGKIIEEGNNISIIYHAENPNSKYNYAPIQHEHMRFKHRVGSAKYLEKPIRENYDHLKEIIIKEIFK